MKTRARRSVLAAAALCVAVVPLAAGQLPASAAQTSVHSQAALTFVDINGATVTCTIFNDSTHNTDNPNQPYATVGGGESGASNSCFDLVLMTLTIRYKDKNGTVRTSSFSSFATGAARVEGAYSAITTSVKAEYFDCDSSRSATCQITASAAPK